MPDRPTTRAWEALAAELGRIGIAICYDGWFPKTFRQLVLAGAEIVCIPTNWVPMPNQPAGEAAMANTLHRAAANSNGIFIACADRVGSIPPWASAG